MQMDDVTEGRNEVFLPDAPPSLDHGSLRAPPVIHSLTWSLAHTMLVCLVPHSFPAATSEVSLASTTVFDHFNEGDIVVVVKEEMEDGIVKRSTVFGESACVMNPDWNGMVKVKITTGAFVNEIKAYR